MLATTGERVTDAREDGPRCAWCGAGAKPDRGRLARCPQCGAATTFPPPSDQELDLAYAGWYRPETGRFSGGGDRVLAISRAMLARRLDRIAPPGPLLDVGCGEGWLLEAVRRRGREALGLERVARADGIIAAEITDFEDRLGGWAGVVFWHSLEHLRDPAGAVDRAAELLAPGGVLVIAVPNLDSWQARLFGPRWFHLDLPRHLVHLPSSALRARVEARGLTVERFSHWRGGQLVFGWLHGMVGSLPTRPDLYGAIRYAEARDRPIEGRRRGAVLVAASALAPVAAVLTAAEVRARAGGTVCLEARRR